jgi:hypothetical protein
MMLLVRSAYMHPSGASSNVGVARLLLQLLHPPEPDPLVATPTEGVRGAAAVRDPPVGSTEDQHLHQLVEDDPGRDPRPVADQGVRA